MKRLIKMDFCRSISSARFLFAVIGMFVFLFLSAEDLLRQWISYKANYGAVDLLLQPMAMDKYKVVMAVILCVIYTDAYCQDDKSGNLKNVLSRTDMVSYAVSKAIVNMLGIILVSVLSFTATYFLFRLMGMPAIGKNHTVYYTIANDHPFVYVLMTAVEFGMVVSACSMVGMIISTVQPSAFVSIGCGGLAFFLAVSFIPLGTPFDVYNLVSMGPTLSTGWDTPLPVMFAWGMLYPLCVIGICTALFVRRLTRRVEDGTL